MAADSNEHRDPHTGVATTGHTWDGIRELNNPLPRWWLWIFYATIIWSIGYWVVYPSWPLIASYTPGTFGWSSRAEVKQELEALRAQRGTMLERIGKATVTEIERDRDLLAFARAQGKAAFGDNCAGCHGAGGGGAKGYPNLNDDEWLWGGTLAEIEHSIRHGIRSGTPDARQGSMPAFGRDGLLKRAEIATLSDYVRSLSGLPVEKGADLAAGKALFAANCASCHGAEGKGNREVGAPSLTDQIWLYGSDHKVIADGLWNGRGNVMPAWSARLDDATVKALAVYVHTLGGGR